MKDEAKSLVSDLQIYANGLALAIQQGKTQEGLEYIQKMTNQLSQVKQYLELKKSIPKNK